MEEKIFKFYQIDNKDFIELNKKNINNIEYILLLQNNIPNSFYLGKVVAENTVALQINNGYTAKILADFLKDEETHKSLQFIVDKMN